MGVDQKIPNDAKVTFFNGFYRLMTLSARPGRLGLIPKKATFMVAEQLIPKISNPRFEFKSQDLSLNNFTNCRNI
jgi:hypothetical protein